MIWFLFGIISFTYLLNKISLDYGFEKLYYNMEIEKMVAEIGEDITINSIIENNKPLTVSFLKVEERFPSGFYEELNVYSLFVMPYQKVKRTYSITAKERGLHHFKNTYLDLGDFTGFNRKFQEEKIDNKIIILPEKIELEKNIEAVGDLYGDISVKRWIIDDPLMTVGIREYTERDPQNYIHWPSSIKYGELMVKQFDFTMDNSVMILLNIESSKPYWKDIKSTSIEEAIKLCRAVIENMEELKIPYGFATNAYNINVDNNSGHYYYPGTGKSHKDNFLEILGSINYAISSTFEETLDNIIRKKGSYTTVIIITPKILDTYIAPLNDLGKVTTKTVVISIEDDNFNGLRNNILKYRRNTNV